MSGTGGMDAVREGLARGLARFLAPVRLPDGYAPAFADRPRGAVFDLAANAAAAEALAHPLLGGAEGALDLLLALSVDGVAPRALGPARVAVEDEAPRRLRITTPHHVFTGDLFRGELHQRPHGIEGPPPVVHGGNLVEFTWRGRKHCLDVEDAIVAAGIEPTEGGVRVFHESAVAGRGRFARGPLRELARLRYAYDIRPDTPALTLTVTLTPLPGVTFDRVRVTTACDGLQDIHYGTLEFGEGATARAIASPHGANITVQDGPVARYAARQDRAAGRALVLAIRPLGPAPLLSVKANGPAERRLHWLLARYAAPSLASGDTLSAREERLLLAGLAAPLDAPRGADAARAAPAAALALALATHALVAPGSRGAALRAGAARLLAGFEAQGAAPADLAQALMATQALQRATGDAALVPRMEALAAALLATQGGGGVFREPEAAASLADHATALLALARRVAMAPDAATHAALRRGVAALGLATLDGPVDTLGLRGPDGAAAATTEDLARLLRALRAVQGARAAGTPAWPEEEARRLTFLAATATTLLQARIRPEGEVLVAAAGAPGTPSSLAAQAATLAALLPPETALARVAA
jgi:hypothetical protein